MNQVCKIWTITTVEKDSRGQMKAKSVHFFWGLIEALARLQDWSSYGGKCVYSLMEPLQDIVGWPRVWSLAKLYDAQRLSF